MTDEEWRPIPLAGLEGRYSVSDRGRVRNDRTGAIRKLRKMSEASGGHLDVELYIGGGREKKFLVHHLVLTAFVGPRPEGMETCHRDGDPENNHVSNLYWGTHADNMRDRLAHGTNPNAAKTNCGTCGRPYAGENLYVDPRGHRRCRYCRWVERRRRNGLPVPI